MFRGTEQIPATIHRPLIMRAFAVQRFGEPPAIHDLPMPSADGAFLIRVRSAGVNPFDYALVDRLAEQRAIPISPIPTYVTPGTGLGTTTTGPGTTVTNPNPGSVQ